MWHTHLFSVSTILLLRTTWAISQSTGTVSDVSSRAQDPIEVLDGFINAANSGTLVGDAFVNAVKAELEIVRPTSTPKSLPQALSAVQSIFASQPQPRPLIESAAELMLSGFAPSNLQDVLTAYGPENSATNVNTRNPSKPVFPKAGRDDAPFTQTMKQMRKQIYIPSEFTYGAKQPVIFMPGTGLRGFMCFDQNMAKLLRGAPYADPVYINPPGYQLADAQLNAETAAYAINYISGISKGRNVSVVAWSQGSISTHWAVKYWPSARQKVSSVITYSGDYHGTVVAPIVCNPANPCAPSLIQQEYESNFIKALRSSGGDSAYVPTTNIYSGLFDEIVEPQQGTGASAYLRDDRGVGVLNAEIQSVCGAAPGGGFATHESVLYQSLTKALTMDALKHGSVASLKRVNLTEVCKHAVAPGLSVNDVVVTESLIPFAVYQVLSYPAKVKKEPQIKPYARR